MKPSLRARGTLKDVAKAVGVSHTTVSNAFNRPDQLSSGLRERVVATARSMSYPGPNPAARMLRTGFARTIAVVWTDPMPHAFEDQAAAAFLAGVAGGRKPNETLGCFWFREASEGLAVCGWRRSTV
jgi:hypothetical protein